MRPKSLILLSLALGCGLIASLGINQVMSKGSPVAAPTGETEAILVALQDVPANEILTPQMFKLEQWPKDKIQDGMLRKIEDADGRRTRQRLFKGEPLLNQKLLAKGEAGERATDHIPPGYRVVAVRVDAESTGGYLIKPGDRVDLIVYIRKNAANGIHQTFTKTFLQDVKVFAVDSTIKEVEGAEGSKSITAKTVSLLLKPEEIELVTLAQNTGDITLSLRSPQEDGLVQTRGANAQMLVHESGDASSRHEEQPQLPAPTTPLVEEPQRDLFEEMLAKVDMSSLSKKVTASPKTHRMQIISGGDIKTYELEEGSEEPRLVPNHSAPASAVPPVLDPLDFGTSSLDLPSNGS